MISEKSMDLIKHHEGLRLKPYKDSVGILTVGYGHNLEVDISQTQANRYLHDDLITVEEDLEKFDWYKTLDPIRQAVVQNMVFNLGITRFKHFKKTIYFIEQAKYSEAALEMKDSKWYLQVGNRAKTLSFMMKTGNWS